MDHVRGFFGTAQAIVLLIVLVILAWKYFLSDWLFPELPDLRAKVSHQIFSACLNEDVRWIRARVEIRNSGADEIALDRGRHSLAQIAPASQLRDTPVAQSEPIDWPVITSTQDATTENLEPAAMTSRVVDFLVDPSIRVVEITSVYASVADDPDSISATWQSATVYETGDPGCDR